MEAPDRIDLELIRHKFNGEISITPDQIDRVGQIKNRIHDLAILFLAASPNSHERDVAFDKLQEAAYWAAKAIFDNE